MLLLPAVIPLSDSAGEFISTDDGSFEKYFPDGYSVFLTIKWNHYDILSAIEERGIKVTAGQLKSIANYLSSGLRDTCKSHGWVAIDDNLTTAIEDAIEAKPLVDFLELHGATLGERDLTSYLDTLSLAYPGPEDLLRIKPLLLALPFSTSHDPLRCLAKDLLTCLD